MSNQRFREDFEEDRFTEFGPGFKYHRKRTEAASGVASLGVPPGVMWAYGGSVAPPGWLLCDGAAISRTTYAALFALIGVAYGAGDTTTTFNVPSATSRFPIGVGVTAMGAVGGTWDHKHGSPITSGANSAAWLVDIAGPNIVADDPHTHDVVLPPENPPYWTCAWIIKY